MSEIVVTEHLTLDGVMQAPGRAGEDTRGGPERGARLNPDNYPTPESLLVDWSKVEAYVRDFLSGLNDEDLTREVEFTLGGPEKYSMLLGHLMHHAAAHAVHHRAQVALMLRMMGYEPGDFDLLLYYAEKRGVSL